MDTISTTMPRLESESEENDSKVSIIARNAQLVNIAMSGKYSKCGEIFVEAEETLQFTLVCALCEKQFTDMKLFGAHITCVHWSSEKFEPFLTETVKEEPFLTETVKEEPFSIETVKEEFSIEEDPFQDEKIFDKCSNVSCDGGFDEMDAELLHIKESTSDDSDNTSENSSERFSPECIKNRKARKNLEQGKWVELCLKCGKLKNKQDYEIHCCRKHGQLTEEEKKRLDEQEASINYVSHTCTICFATYKYKSDFIAHLKLKHNCGTKERSSKICLQQGKWVEFCGKCGVKFKSHADYHIHKICRHSNLSEKEKKPYREEEASIIYVAYKCLMCPAEFKFKNYLIKHMKSKHLLSSERIKFGLEEEFWSSRDETKTDLNDDVPWKKSYHKFKNKTEPTHKLTRLWKLKKKKENDEAN